MSWDYWAGVATGFLAWGAIVIVLVLLARSFQRTSEFPGDRL